MHQIMVLKQNVQAKILKMKILHIYTTTERRGVQEGGCQLSEINFVTMEAQAKSLFVTANYGSMPF
jgi:hypothetical protein